MSHHRRDFLAKSLLLAGAAGIAASGLRPGAAGAQTAPRPIRRSERYDDSFITERKPFKWPDDNSLAVWFAPNVEVWQYDSAFGVGITPNPPTTCRMFSTTPGGNTECASAYGASPTCSTRPV